MARRRKFTAAFARAGITVLENEAAPLPGTPVWVVGVGDDDTSHSQPGRAMRKVPKGAHALVVPGAAPRDWAYGWVGHGDNRRYITSGLGVSILPARFNMRPEWVMFTLSGAKAKPKAKASA